MDAKQIIIKQENEALIDLLNALETAQNAWEAAGKKWETDLSEEAGKELDAAVSAYNRVAVDIAQHMRSSVNAGFRLCCD